MTLRSFTLFLLLAVFAVTPAFAVVAPIAPPTANEATALEAAREYRESLKNMTAKERRALKRDQRHAVKDAIRAYREGNAPSTNTLLLVILAILLPPVAVLVYEGELTSRFWICLLLTLLFYIPGLIYALITIFE